MVETGETCYIMLHPISSNHAMLINCLQWWKMGTSKPEGKPPVVEFGMGLKFDHILCARNKKTPACQLSYVYKISGPCKILVIE